VEEIGHDPESVVRRLRKVKPELRGVDEVVDDYVPQSASAARSEPAAVGQREEGLPKQGTGRIDPGLGRQRGAEMQGHLQDADIGRPERAVMVHEAGRCPGDLVPRRDPRPSLGGGHQHPGRRVDELPEPVVMSGDGLAVTEEFRWRGTITAEEGSPIGRHHEQR